jgi:hypothetical protein
VALPGLRQDPPGGPQDYALGMLIYTTSSDPTTLNVSDLAGKLRAVLSEAKTRFAAIDAPSRPSAEGKWSPQQVVGHLCDSAMNNQQRIVRMQLARTLVFPGYEQEGWVRVQRYEGRTWDAVVGLFFALNEHLAHTVEGIDPEALGHTWMFEGEALTLGFIVEDYIAHLEHHLRTI